MSRYFSFPLFCISTLYIFLCDFFTQTNFIITKKNTVVFLIFIFTLQLFVYMGSLKLLICIAFLTHCHNSIDIHKLFHVQWVSVPHLMVKKLTASDLLGLLYYDFPYLIIKGIYDMATGNIVIARKYKDLKHLDC